MRSFSNGTMQAPLLIAASLLVTGIVPARAERSFFEGTWARTMAECRDREGPSSGTVIDLRGRETGPLFDQYENHCRITRVSPAGTGVTLQLSCHEFWDDFNRRANARRTSATLLPVDAGRILIDGKRYIRCPR